MAYRYLTVKRDGKTVLLHRWLMEQHIGRKLSAGEHVHHKNGDRKDNRLENLELISAADHLQEHAEEKRKHPNTKPCEVCGTEFTPARTKRKRAKTCSEACRWTLTSKSMAQSHARRRPA